MDSNGGITSLSKGGHGSLQLVTNYTSYVPTGGHESNGISFTTTIGYQPSPSPISQYTDHRMASLAMSTALMYSTFLFFRFHHKVLVPVHRRAPAHDQLCSTPQRTMHPRTHPQATSLLTVTFRLVPHAFARMLLGAEARRAGPFRVGACEHRTWEAPTARVDEERWCFR